MLVAAGCMLLLGRGREEGPNAVIISSSVNLLASYRSISKVLETTILIGQRYLGRI